MTTPSRHDAGADLGVTSRILAAAVSACLFTAALPGCKSSEPAAAAPASPTAAAPAAAPPASEAPPAEKPATPGPTAPEPAPEKSAPEQPALEKPAPEQPAPETPTDGAAVPSAEVPTDPTAAPEAPALSIPKGDGARAALMAKAGATALVTSVKAAIEAVATARDQDGGSPSDITETPSWGALTQVVATPIGSFVPGSPETLTPVLDVAAAAAELVTSDRVTVRHAAYRTLELVLHALARSPDLDAGEPVRAVIYERYALAENKERLALVESASAGAGPTAAGFFTAVAELEKAPAVRAAAIAALDACPSDRCFIDEARVKAWAAAASEAPVRSAAFALAGRLKQAEVLGWCEGLLDDVGLGGGCRSALVRLGTPDAMKRLDAWITTVLASPRATLPELGAWVGLMAPFAETPDGATRYAEVLKAALGRADLHPDAALALVRSIAAIKDDAVAKSLYDRAEKTWDKEFAVRTAVEAPRIGAILDAIERSRRGRLIERQRQEEAARGATAPK
ncbi:MAG: hypothetical protein IV100_06775 [Myxococcales bacterium]|nr:hypothetical protein [Myxococcales bacterium]